MLAASSCASAARRIDTNVTDDKRFNAYSLRRTFATRLKYADVQEFAISELMDTRLRRLLLEVAEAEARR